MSTIPRVCALAFALGVASISESALAEPVVSTEVRGELLFGRDAFGREIYGGPGIAAGFGYALDTYPFLVMPEIVLAGAFYPGEIAGSARASAGLRFGITTFVEPCLFVHAGYAAMPSDAELAHAVAVDAGLGLEKRLSRHFTMGGTLAYQGLFYERAAHGLQGGLRLGFWL